MSSSQQSKEINFLKISGNVSGTQAKLRTVFPTLAASNEGLHARNCPVTAGVSHIEAIWAAGNDVAADLTPRLRSGQAIECPVVRRTPIVAPSLISDGSNL